jgi:hypothetical protein
MQTEARFTLETHIQEDAAIVRCGGKLTAGVTEFFPRKLNG